MSKSFRCLMTLVVVALLSALCVAQSTKGVIAGVVTDSTGAVVTNANITVTGEETGETRTTATGPNGEYRVEALIPGSYSVTVEAPRFSTTQVKGVMVRTSQVTSTNISLSIEQTAQTIEVQANLETIQTETGELSKTIPPVEVRDLPITGGNPFTLATTLPGVADVSSRDAMTNGAGFSVNGLRPRSNNFLIDGFDDNDNSIAGQAFQPANQEAVQEVTVLTNSYSAEYGRGGASVSNLSFKSGTNVYHGSAWWNYDASALDALSTQQKLGDSTLTRPPQYVQNVFGFTAGGPVIKQKLFFFGTSQWTRNFGASTYASTLSLPTEQGVAALQALGSNQNVDLMLGAIGSLRGNPVGATPVNIGPRANCPADSVDNAGNCQIYFGNFRRADHTASKSYEWTVRADYIATQNDTLYVRFTNSNGSFSPDLFANSGALPSQDTYQGGPSRLFGAMWAHTFNANVINEFRFSAQQIDFTFAPLGSTLASPYANLPTYSLSSTTSMFWGGYSQASFPQGRGHNTFQFQDAVSMNRGSHAFKFGVDMGIFLMHDIIPFNANGLITVSAGGDCGPTVVGGCTDLQNYLDNYIGPDGGISRSFGNPRLNIPTSQQAYYFQDSWKLRPNLTLNYGLRYEYQPPDGENILSYPSYNPATLFAQPLQTRVTVKADRNNFGPRFGFAYTPKWGKRIFGEDKTVIRGGYGVFYDTFFTNIADNSASTSPNSLGDSLVGGTDPANTGRGELNPTAYLAGIAPVFKPTATVYSTSNNLVNPQIHQWNFGFQRELPGSFILESAYVGTRGERLFVTQQLNPGDANTGARINPDYGSVNLRTNKGDSIYHGWQSTVSRSMKNLTLRGSYTWARSIDNQSEIFYTSNNDARWMISGDPRSDRGPSAFNRTHRVSLAYVYNLPSLANHGFITAILGGWSTSGTLSYQTGAPQTIMMSGYDQNGDFILNDRPSWGNPKAPLNYSTACLTDTTATCISGIGYDDGSGSVTDFNTGAPGTKNQFRYIGTAYGTNGNVTRNSYMWPGQFSENMTVRKEFRMPFREGHTLQVRADLFNVWNHKNAGIANLLDGGDISNPHFMDLARTIDGNRNIVLWLKYSF